MLKQSGRKLGMYLNRRNKVKQEGQRREIFLRYLGEVASAVGEIKDLGDKNKTSLYQQLLGVAKKRTQEADTKLDDRGRKVSRLEDELGEHVLIVNPEDQMATSKRA